ALDCAGNLWLGGRDGGVMRIAHNGVSTYTVADGLSFTGTISPALFRDRSGAAHIAFQCIINVRRGNRFVEVRPAIPKKITYAGWGWHQIVLQDHTGDWWIATGEGLVRFPPVTIEALSRTPPKALYTQRDGLVTNDIFRIFEDNSGGIWIACIGPGGVNGLS